MGRPSTPSKNALGVAMHARRGEKTGDEAAIELGIYKNTYYRLERGTHKPSADTARALAKWLGWTTDQVLDAARESARDGQNSSS